MDMQHAITEWKPSSPLTRLRGILLTAAAIALLLLIFRHSGVTHNAAQNRQARHVLRVWDWCSPATDEKYGDYFAAAEREFEAAHPDVDVVYQYIPFGQYEQKMATALVGSSPPDVFQCSVYWAEGFYDRGMLLPLNVFLQRERQAIQNPKPVLSAAEGSKIQNSDEIVAPEVYLASAWKHNHKPDGTVFGIPQILDAECLAWNLDILQKAAETDPEIRGMFLRKPDGSTDYDHLRFDAVQDWEQFRRIVRKLTKYDSSGHIALDSNGDFLQAGFAIHAHGAGVGPVMPWCAANGSNFQDSEGTRAMFANEAGIEATQFVLNLYWNDHVSPPFRRQMEDEEIFDRGKVACIVAGTWSGKYITRGTEGRLRFDFTPFPPGPHGNGHTTLTWGNMLSISRRSRQADIAWEYVKFITTHSGSLRLLRYTEQNSPRQDFYKGKDWLEMCRRRPYLHNIPAICASGKKLRHTQINAVDFASQPIFETLLLRYPEIEKGQGPYPSVRAGVETAARAVDRVYRRYNAQVAQWHARTGAGFE